MKPDDVKFYEISLPAINLSVSPDPDGQWVSRTSFDLVVLNLMKQIRALERRLYAKRTECDLLREANILPGLALSRQPFVPEEE